MLGKIFKTLGILVLIILILGVVVGVIYYPTVKKLYLGNEVIHPDSSISIYLGGGGNTVVYNSDSVILVVDTKFGKAAQKLHKEVESLAAGKRIIVVNTHSDLDHTGGNPLYKNAEIISGRVEENYWIHSNGAEGMPTIWLTDTLSFKMGDETVTLINMGQAHTWCDIIVYFQKRRLLMSGDLIFNGINAFLDIKKGSNGAKSIEALKRLNSIPTIEMIVPGHGEMGGRELISNMQTYLEDMSLAAEKPEIEKEMRRKYKKLASMPGMTSTALVIDYFRKHP